MQLPQILRIANPRLADLIRRSRKQLARFIDNGDVVHTGEGTIIGGRFRGNGVYHHRIRQRGLEWSYDHNLLVDEGILKILGLALFTDAKISQYYLALTSGNTAPVAGLKASNFAATMGEITSQAEGYASATRPQWVPAAPAANAITNAASEAEFDIVTSASVTITGAALLSSSARGATDGFLISASQFANSRQLFNGETFDLGYQVSLTD